MRPGAAQQASWGLWWGCAWASARELRWGMRRGDGVCVGHGAWGVAVALVESVGGLGGLGCRFSLPVVAPYAPGGGLLWVPRWSAGSPNHDGVSAASGCRTRDARWTRAQKLPWEHLRAAHPEIRRDACFLAACIVFLKGKQAEVLSSVREAGNGPERAHMLATTILYNALSLTMNDLFD